ncbi:MAG: acetyl-CoA carboxylase carboxyl transferase subunit beta, partial [Flavobacteriia bacterium]
ETIGRDLPEGFQTAEFVLEHGFLDYIVDRTKLKETLSLSLKLFMN